MDKQQLQTIFSSPYSSNDWKKVLVGVFGVQKLHQQPHPITLPANDKAYRAFELGSFTTTDDRLVGIYQVDVKPQVWLERNKVGLRDLLRNIYKYDVDGALIVFAQENKWRLSLVSEIRTVTEDGKPIKIATEPKRHTYILGEGEKTKTPASQLNNLIGKAIRLEDIRKSFSVDTLNEEFYKDIAQHFYQLVGATTGKGKKQIKYDKLLKLPGISETDSRTYQEFAVRLIGRIVFCWFLKTKKSKAGISLLPDNLLSSEAVKRNRSYYHIVLEKIFFQTLNTPIEERLTNLPKGCEQIPFLNGGLFEPHHEDFYKPNKATGLSSNINTLTLPDEWFISFFQRLEQYNFTIDENSIVDIEVSVDPEMLGRIFENLLAEIDPDSGETARKATGSFYTPRDIVDYMANESLVYYLHNETGIARETLSPIFKIDASVNFEKADNEKILTALDKLKVLDPACGSGAFPMGVLQKIVMALEKLDKEAKWWKAKQVSRIDNAIVRKQFKEKLDSSSVQYARKLGIIQNSLYGVDIQPIAAEISKLRCFLTLIVDENIDENKPNRGVEPLPNLEFKFVTADTLLKLPEETDFGGLFNSNEDLEKLHQLRTDYLQSYGEQKNEIKEAFLQLQKAIFKQQISARTGENNRAFKLSTWNPFNNEKTDWFDPQWMFGIKQFNLIIGNPPYVLLQSKNRGIMDIKLIKENYSVASYKVDLYHLFLERGIRLLLDKGILAFITPSNFLTNNYTAELRKFILTNTELKNIISINNNAFAASVNTCISILEKTQSNHRKATLSTGDVSNNQFNILNSISRNQREFNENSLLISGSNDKIDKVLKKIESDNEIVKAHFNVNFGMQLRDRSEYPNDVLKDPTKSILTNDHRKCFTGKDINHYDVSYNNMYCYFNRIAKRGGCWDEKVHNAKNKILVRQVGVIPIAGLDTLGYPVLNSAFLITPVSEKISTKFLLALINSKVISFYWLSKFADKRKTFPKIKGTYLGLLPIPRASSIEINKIINLVEMIIASRKEGKNTIHLEDKIDSIVFRLYKLDSDEVSCVHEVTMNYLSQD